MGIKRSSKSTEWSLTGSIWRVLDARVLIYYVVYMVFTLLQLSIWLGGVINDQILNIVGRGGSAALCALKLSWCFLSPKTRNLKTSLNPKPYLASRDSDAVSRSQGFDADSRIKGLGFRSLGFRDPLWDLSGGYKGIHKGTIIRVYDFGWGFLGLCGLRV